MTLKILVAALFSAILIWFYSSGLEQLLTPPSNLSSVKSAPTQNTETSPTVWSETEIQRQEQHAIQLINQLRQSLNLPPFAPNPILSNTARQHALYSVQNDQQSHQQQPGLANFSGETPKQRAFSSGYHSPVREVIAYNKPSADLLIGDLMSAIYHRLTLLNFTHTQIGLGIADDQHGKVKTALVAQTGNADLNQLCQSPQAAKLGRYYYQDLCQSGIRVSQKAYQMALNVPAMAAPKLIHWPANHAEVAPVFYEEEPDPLPNCNVSGYPVHVQINPIYKGRIQFINNSFKLYQLSDSGKRAVTAEAILTNLTDPNDRYPHLQNSKPEWIALFPKHRLHWNQTYQAEMDWQEGGQRHHLHWQFHTPKQPGLVIIPSTSPKSVSVSISPGQTRTLYFAPAGCQGEPQASIKTRTPRGLQLKTHFVDGETLQVQLVSANHGERFSVYYQPTDTWVHFQVNQR
ncbi:hypothetical protein CYQ88_05425 [Hydrogenovibrio sp. SC-1]|uniref:CAP domain-containing protein n=1 Tax=Hydrogenovibrio sp. SC-1 TaxID=2065820 RepID=UPI000C7A5831|nr:CAP domain-containing protein [Hydrogenovibrio sp. SC-1]PLA74521.1 hypothetical protein CYQ88_05425 [Hydrogenovibrio sp. SC-1]